MNDPLCTACSHHNPAGAAFCEACGGDLSVSWCGCTACGHVGRAGARFCAACGARLPRPPGPDQCRACAAMVRPADRFCAACGAPVHGAPPPVSAPAAPSHATPTPRPPAAMQQARANAATEPAPTEEERKLVTVLFADVSGFTAMSERLDPEQVRDIMDQCFERLTREIVTRGGTIDKYIGDAVMAYFGVPVAHEDDAPQSVRAALGMLDALAAFSRELARDHDLSLTMRIGLNTGKVLAGLVGGEGHKDFTIYGDTVNTASRLEHAAEPGTVMMSHDTYLAVRGWFEVIELPAIKVKGKEKPLRVYRAVQERLRPSALGMRGIEGVDVPMVGRDLELRVLQEWYAEVQREGRARVVTITGQGGIGKSRLVAEASLRWALEESGLRLYKGRVLPPGSGAPLNLVRDLVGDLLDDRTEPGDTLASRAEAAGADPADAVALSLLLGAGALPEAPGERELQLARALRATRALVERRAVAGPTILVCEDIHWATDTVLDFIDHLGATLELPVLLLCLARPELFERRRLWAEGKPHQFRVDLRPLSDMAASELMHLILHRLDEVPPALVEAVVSRAGGNPFYVEELVKVMLETGVLLRGAGADDPWTLADGWAEHLDIPASIHGLIQSRVDALPRGERAVLQRAAVIGRVFWSGAVVRLTGRDVGAEVDALRGRDLCVAREASSIADQDELQFRNALLHEVVYDRILHRDRKPLHAQAAAWLEEAAGGRDAATGFPRYALHLERAGRPVEALAAYAAAAERARELYANGEALELLRTALGLLEDPAVAEQVDAATQLALLRSLGEVGDLAAAYDDAMGAFERALGLCDVAGATAEERAALRCGLGDVHVRRGDLDAARREGQGALSLLGDVPSGDMRARALELLGRASFYKGDYDPALQRCEEALAARPTPRLRAQTLRTLSMVHIRRGELEASQRCVSEALGVAKTLGDELLAGRMTLMQGNIHNLRGEADRAIEEYDRARKSAERLGDLHTARMCHNNLGELLLELDRWEEAGEPLERSITLCNVLSVRNQVSDTHRLLGEVRLRQGDVAAARESGDRALALAQETGEKSFAAEAERFLGQVELAEGGAAALEAAEAHLARAEALLVALGSEVLLGKSLYHFATSLLRVPEGTAELRTRARAHLERARDLFERLGMEGDRARAAEALEGV